MLPAAQARPPRLPPAPCQPTSPAPRGWRREPPSRCNSQPGDGPAGGLLRSGLPVIVAVPNLLPDLIACACRQESAQTAMIPDRSLLSAAGRNHRARLAIQTSCSLHTNRNGDSMKILMVLTSHDRLGDTGKKTGFWLEEFAAPYYVFKDAGADITLASPKGGQPPLDPKSDEPDAQTDATRRFKADAESQRALASTAPLSSIEVKDYDAVFYPG